MPVFQSQSIVYGRAWVDMVLAAFSVNPGAALVVGAKLRLSKSPTFAPAPTSVIADFDVAEADFTGYPAGGAAATLSAGLELSGVVQGVLTSGLFIATNGGPFTACTAYGWWIDDGTLFIAGERFPDSQQAQFQEPGAFLDLIAFLPIGLYQPAA